MSGPAPSRNAPSVSLHRLQRLAVGVEGGPAGRAAESWAEADQLAVLVRQDVGLQRREAFGLHLGAKGGNVVVGLQRRHAHQFVVPDAVRAAMRPIHRNAGAHRAAEQFVDGHAERLALKVEQSVTDRGDGALVHAIRGLHLLDVQASNRSPGPGADRSRSSCSAMPWMTAVRPRLPSASVYSDQPIKPSSVVILRKLNVRHPASQCRSSMRTIFMVSSWVRADEGRLVRSAATVASRCPLVARRCLRERRSPSVRTINAGCPARTVSLVSSRLTSILSISRAAAPPLAGKRPTGPRAYRSVLRAPSICRGLGAPTRATGRLLIPAAARRRTGSPRVGPRDGKSCFRHG